MTHEKRYLTKPEFPIAYWITLCSLSALEDLPYIPRKLVPILTQWIATHLLSGRRTFYREVLSTEISDYAVHAFLALDCLNQVHGKEKLTPDAQILLLELGINTNEDLLTAATVPKPKVDTIEEIENLPLSESQQVLLLFSCSLCLGVMLTLLFLLIRKSLNPKRMRLMI